MVTNTRSTYYQGVRGGVLPIDAPTYVPRDADDELYEFCRSTEANNRACYVLAPRQMGKTSLMVRTANRLANEAEEEIVCVKINLQSFGKAVSEDLLYLSLLRKTCQQVKSQDNLLPELDRFWNKNRLFALQFQEFAQKLVQQTGNKKIIIFLDEIQSLVYWGLQDSFLGFIKSLSSEGSLENITFVLLGVVKPSDLLTDAMFAFNTAKLIELKNLEGHCKPLLFGLETVSDEPKTVLQEIIYWTGGQPFLTQVLCDLAVNNLRLKEESSVKHHIEKLVRSKIIQDWRRQDRQSHFQGIESWFTRGDPAKMKEKLLALNQYQRLLKSKSSVRFDERKTEQMDLIISGLVAKLYQYIKVTNPIYREIFNEGWIEETKQIIQNKEGYMPSTKILNRDVFILVDQSQSMMEKDEETEDNKTRWDFIKEELLKGDIRKILEHSSDGKKICEEAILYLFSRKRIGLDFIVQSPDDLDIIFRENTPDTNTFIAPTFEKCVDTWFEEGRKQGREAFIIIYTDGMLSDRRQFERIIAQTCQKLKNQDEIKVIMIGVGERVYSNPIPFLELDFNLKQNQDAKGNPCNIFVFDLANEMEDILELLSRQLEGNPEQKIPEWVKERHPDWYEKYLQQIEE